MNVTLENILKQKTVLDFNSISNITVFMIK